MAKRKYVEYITILWGLPKNSSSGVVRAMFGKHAEKEMVRFLSEKKFGAGNPPFELCVVWTFEFTGRDAEKVHFLAALSEPLSPMINFTGVFANLASSVSYAMLIPKEGGPRRRLWNAPTRNIENNFNIQNETKFLASGQDIPAFNFWPMLHRFERRVHGVILQDPEAFANVLWSEAIRKRE